MVTDLSLKAISDGCPNLTSVNISWCDGITENGKYFSFCSLLILYICQIVIYSKKHNFSHFNYHLCDINLHRLSLVKDLGILFDSKLLFNVHVLAIKNKALAIFGMIKRNCSNFYDPLVFKCVYTSLVRSLLEYSLLIQEHNNADNDQLEKVQNKVLRFICYKCNILKTPHSGHKNILKLLN
jgi:hypothetical protein